MNIKMPLIGKLQRDGAHRIILSLRKGTDVLELTPIKICPDFDKWPGSWQSMPEDLEYGRKLLGILSHFVRRSNENRTQ